MGNSTNPPLRFHYKRVNLRATRDLELRAEHELHPPRSARTRRSGIQYSGDAAETGRRLDRGRIAADRPHTRARRLVLRMVHQVERRRAEVQANALGHSEPLLQRRIDLISSRP